MVKKGGSSMKGKEKEEKQVKPVEKEVNKELFNLENELKNEKMYLQSGFKEYLNRKGVIVDTKAKYVRYMKEYKEA